MCQSCTWNLTFVFRKTAGHVPKVLHMVLFSICNAHLFLDGAVLVTVNLIKVMTMYFLLLCSKSLVGQLEVCFVN